MSHFDRNLLDNNNLSMAQTSTVLLTHYTLTFIGGKNRATGFQIHMKRVQRPNYLVKQVKVFSLRWTFCFLFQATLPYSALI